MGNVKGKCDALILQDIFRKEASAGMEAETPLEYDSNGHIHRIVRSHSGDTD